MSVETLHTAQTYVPPLFPTSGREQVELYHGNNQCLNSYHGNNQCLNSYTYSTKVMFSTSFKVSYRADHNGTS